MDLVAVKDAAAKLDALMLAREFRQDAAIS
jgi:hypothetical protein